MRSTILCLTAGVMALPSAAQADTEAKPPAPAETTSAATSDTTSGALNAEEERALLESLRQSEEAAVNDPEHEPAHDPAHDSAHDPGHEAVGKVVGDAIGAAMSAMQGADLELSLILDVAASWFSDEPRQLGEHDPKQTGFTLQQLALSIGASVDPFFRFYAEVVLSEHGVELDEAYAATRGLPGNLQVRVGQFLTRFGRVNHRHPHTGDFVDQVLVLGTFFGGEGNRALGGELSWVTPLPWTVELIGSVTHAEGDCCARSYVGVDRSAIEGFGDFLYTTAVTQFFELGDHISLHWGLSAQFGPNPTGADNRTEIYGSDLHLSWRPTDSTSKTALNLTAEGMFRSRQVPGAVLQDGGLYAQLVWEITAAWGTGVRYEIVSGVRGDYLEEPVPSDRGTHRQRGSVQITYRPSSFARLRMQANIDAPAARVDPFFALMMSLELVTGAHASHAL